MKFTLASTLVVLSAVVSTVLAAPRPNPVAGVSGTNATDGVAEQDTPRTWTVIVNKNDPRTLEQMIADMGDVKVNHIYNNTAFKGFSCTMSPNSASVMSTTGFKTFEPDRKFYAANSQPNAPWGLQRLSQGNTIEGANDFDLEKTAAIDFTFQFEGGLNQTGTLGKGVDIYVIDTGVNVDHVDFDGRATFGFTIDDKTDDQGHGYV